MARVKEIDNKTKAIISVFRARRDWTTQPVVPNVLPVKGAPLLCIKPSDEHLLLSGC